MIDVLNLLGIGEPTTDFVQQQGVLGPRTPQLLDGLQELVSPVITDVMLEVLAHAEVACLGVVERRDHIPRDPAIRQIVECGKCPSHVIRRVVGRRNRSAQTQSLRHRSHSRYHAGRLQRHRALPAQTDPGLQIIAIAVFDSQAIGKKQQIKLPPLQGPRNLLVKLASQKTVRRTNMAPRAMRMSDVASREKPGQM
jgi:hypothetical protein